MNWPVIWGVIKFDKREHVFVPDNYFASDRISVRFSKDKTFDPAVSYGYDALKLKENEVSFEILCSTWRPDDLQNNNEEWCTSDLDYFSPDEIEIENKQQFVKTSEVVFIKDESKQEFTYVFDSLYERIQNLQNVLTDIIHLPNVKEVIIYFTDSHGEIDIAEHEFYDWQVEKFADKYLDYCLNLLDKSRLSDILPSYYLTYKQSGLLDK